MITDPPADLGPGAPGLDQFLGLLTARPTADELAAQNATLAMFRQNIRPVAPRRRAPVTRRMQFAIAAAAAVVAFAIAAYAEALPGPVQHVAYRVLGFAGVPDAPHHSAATAAHRPPAHHHPVPGGATATGPAPSHRPTGSSSSPRPSASPRPTKKAKVPGGPVALTLTTTDTKIAAGAAVVFTGTVTERGRGVPGVPVGLFEHAARQPGHRLVATATTGSGGQAALRVADLTANAKFWLVGPQHHRSKPVRVVVIPTVSVSVTSGPRGRAVVLTVSSRGAGKDDAVVLQAQRGGFWHNLRVRMLNGNGVARFPLRRHAATRLYRVVMIATAAHGRAVSNQVPVAPS